MSMQKANLPTVGTPQLITSLVGAKTISSVYAYKHGTTYVLEILFSDSSVNFIKIATNQGIEIGGTNELGTGTKVAW